MQHEQMPHTLQMKQRRELTVTGVTEVVSFEDTAVLLQTVMGRLLIQGQQLQLKDFCLEGGQVAVEGSIGSFHYEDAGEKLSWWQRLLG
jgi:sporulation protein YabP